MSIIAKVWKRREILHSIFPTLYFNFHYLPFKQAIKLPILLYKPTFYKLEGRITIDAHQITFGMARFGFPQVSLYPNAGMAWELHGKGEIVIHGKCKIGNASAISVGKKGKIIFGNNFIASTSLKITSYCSIEFKEDVHIGWENIFMDTDFHKLTKVSGGYSKGYNPIVIGSNNWFGLRCTVLKGTQTPDFCVISGNSVLSRKFDEVPTHSLISGNPAQLKRTGIYRNMEDDTIHD